MVITDAAPTLAIISEYRSTDDIPDDLGEVYKKVR